MNNIVIDENVKFEIKVCDMINKNIDLIMIFTRLNKMYGQMAICQKISDWYNQMLKDKDLEARLSKTSSVKIFLDMMQERLFKDKKYNEKMIETKQNNLILRVKYKHKLKKILDVMPIFDEIYETNQKLKQFLMERKQNINDSIEASVKQ